MATQTAKQRLSTLVGAIISTLGAQGVALTSSQSTALYTTASTWIDAQANTSIPLAADKPEYQQLLLQFQNALEQEDAWRDVLTAGSGQAILRFIASAMSMVIYAQERTLQELFIDTARMGSAILASTRSRGVHIARRTPAEVTVALTRNGLDYLVVPRLSVFIINGMEFFNREPAIFQSNVTTPVNVTLYQGRLLTDTYQASGAPWAVYEIGSGDWTISDTDVFLNVGGQDWSLTEDGLYNVGANARTAYTNTFPNGNVEIVTGNGTYGQLPSTGTSITVTYVSTLGATFSNTATGLVVTARDIDGLAGLTTTPITGGREPPTNRFYKANAPYIAARRKRAVTKADYVAAILEYPTIDILDVAVLGQRDIDPDSKAWMNAFKVSVLTAKSATGAPMTTAQWSAFASYLSSQGIFQITAVREDPVSIPLDIDIQIGVAQKVAIEQTKSAAIELLNQAYAPRRGALGSNFYSDDISALLRSKLDPAIRGQINWIKVNSATPDTITVGMLEWVKLRSLVVDVVYTDRSNPIS